MPDNLFTGLLYGPQGPETRRYKSHGQNTWGKCLEDAFEGKDDENFLEKTGIICKYTFGFGTFMTMLDVCLHNNKGGWPVVLQRMKYHYTPWIGCTIAYTATVNLVCGLRGGKTDHTNHVIGGIAAGAVLGKHVSCFRTGLVSALGFAVLGWVYKDSRISGYDVFPAVWEKPAQHGNPFSHKLDTTFWFTPRRGYWARSEEERQQVYENGQLGDGNLKRLW